MAQSGAEKSDLGYNSLRSSEIGRRSMVIGLLRLVALSATLSATIVMALNKETKTFVVATIGTSTVKATLTAKFQDTPANIFFVAANALATLHNLLVLVAMFFGNKIDPKGVRFMAIPILDITNLAILSAGTTSAAYMAEIAKKGNSHAQWNKICDKFATFCSHGAGAILASFLGLAIFLVVILLSTIKRHKIENKSDASIQM